MNGWKLLPLVCLLALAIAAPISEAHADEEAPAPAPTPAPTPPLTPAPASNSDNPDQGNILILGGTVFHESSTLTGEEQVSVQERDQSFDYQNYNRLSARVIYLRPQSERLYLGFGADFVGNYAANIVDDDGPSDPPDVYSFGPLLETMGFAEWRFPLSDDLTFSVGTQLGLAMVFPRGDLAAEIRSLQNNNVRVWRIPRFGGAAGAHTAFRYTIDDRLGLRADLGLQWQNIIMFRTQQTVDGSPFRKHWTTGALRGRLGISLEILL